MKDLGIGGEEECNNLVERMEVGGLANYSHNIQNRLLDKIQNRIVVHNSNRYFSRNHMFVLRTYYRNLMVAMVMEVGKAASTMLQRKLKHCEYFPSYSILAY